MTRRALVIGSGQIGRAVALSLLNDGWSVACAQRNPAELPTCLAVRGVAPIQLDRDNDASLAEVAGGGFDAVVDTVAFRPEHGHQWNGLQEKIGALAVISTGSVYADSEGRTLDEGRTHGYPVYPVPIRESQQRTFASNATYSTRKVALEDTLLEGFDRPLTILRPFAVYGPGNKSPREWWFVIRALKKQASIPLSYAGQSRFHTSATKNIAELCKLAINSGGNNVLNAADPECLTVAEIGHVLLEAMDFVVEFKLIPGAPQEITAWTPWSIPHPIVADMTASTKLGYKSVTDFRTSARRTCADLIKATEGRNWREAFPGLTGYPASMFEPDQ